MRLLLDTHVALWATTDDQRLSKKARKIIADLDNDLAVSVASLWEIAIKHARKPEEMPVPPTRAKEIFEEAGYLLLPIQPNHAAKVGELSNLHKDPFDRMLVAQALCEPRRLVTRDPTVAAYSDTVILV